MTEIKVGGVAERHLEKLPLPAICEESASRAGFKRLGFHRAGTRLIGL